MEHDKEGYPGKWLSTEDGAHFFVRNGETAKQAILRFRASQMISGLPNMAQRILEYERRFGELTTSELKDSLQQELPSGGVTVKKADERPPFGSQEELDKLLGEEFVGYKGQAAVEKLLRERRGHIKGAFHRDDIGDIDLFWGNNGVGLKHIINQRANDKKYRTEEERIRHVYDVLSHIGEIVSKGKYRKTNERGDREYIYNGYGVVIAPTYHKNKITYILTAYKNEASQEK